jgi:hypothetical protein
MAPWMPGRLADQGRRAALMSLCIWATNRATNLSACATGRALLRWHLTTPAQHGGYPSVCSCFLSQPWKSLLSALCAKTSCALMVALALSSMVRRGVIITVLKALPPQPP